VTIQRLTPSTVPEQGRVTVTGRIINRSDTAWRDLKVYLLTSAEPLSTVAELEEATASDPATEIGDRIVVPGLYESVRDLEPGAATRFRVSVPRGELGISGDPGVYWVGVHVLGTDDEGRLEGAEGRARTLVPLVPPGTDSTTVGLAMQYRNRVVRASTGELQFLPWWQQTFTSRGRLGRLLELSRTAGSFPLSWVVDPALLRAATSVQQGNPATELTADPGETQEERVADNDELSSETELPPGGRAAQRWLRRFDDTAASRGVLALPFGDLDTSAAAAAGADDLVTRALGTSAAVLGERGTSSRPVVAPLSGYISPESLQELDADVPAVLSDAAVPGLSTTSPVAQRSTGGRILVVRPRETLFGPAPGNTRSALAVRQQLLAQLALHALSPERETPMPILLPPGWDPGKYWKKAHFFRGLDQPWLQPVALESILDRPADPDDVEADRDVFYPEEQVEAELPPYVVLRAQGVFSDTDTLQELLTEESGVSDELDQMGLLGVSTWSRRFPGAAAERLRGVRGEIGAWLEQITIRSPSFVTMSSEDGEFPVTIVNGLDQPVTVGLRMSVTGGDLKLVTPPPIELPAGGRQLLRVEATSTDIGIHEVTLEPVTTSGKIVGTGTALSVRSSKVGLIVWVIMGVGAGILFLAIVLRISRRIAARRRGGAAR